MRFGDVGLGQGQVAPHHLHRGMAQQPLERVDVAAVAQVGNGKRVAHPVRRDRLHDFSPFPGPQQQLAEGAAVHALAMCRLEHRVIGVCVLAFAQIAPQRVLGHIAHVDRAPLVELAAAHLDGP